MCQIQIIHRFDGKNLTKTDIRQFKRLMLKGSESNDDAWGYYSIGDKRLSKHGGELRWEMLDEINDVKTTTLMGHNRLATHGKANIIENNHPFETENFVVLHNGVLSCHNDLKSINELTYDVETDSYIIPALLEKVYASLGNSLEAIKAVAEVLYGSFSVVVYCKADNKLYYFKDSGTSFNWALARFKTGDVLIGSTRENNFDALYKEYIRGDLFVQDSVELLKGEAKKYKIFEIDTKGLNDASKFVEGSYYNSRNSKWDNTTKTFIKLEVSNKNTSSKFNDNHSSLRGQSHLNNIGEDTYDAYGHKMSKQDIKSMEWIKNCTDALDYVYGDLTAYLLKYFQINVQHEKKNVYEQQTKLILDRSLTTNEKKEIENNYSNYGSIKFNERTKSKISEIWVTINDYMMDNKLPIIVK